MMETEAFKVKVGDKEVELILRSPKPEDVREADKIRSKAYTEAYLKDKMPLAVTAREEAMRRGIWDETKQKELRDAQAELVKCEEILTKSRNLKLGGPGNMDPNTMFQIAIKTQDLRNKIIELRTLFADVEKNTVEGYSENERQNYLLYATTVYKDSGERFFSSFEDFKNSTVFTEENKEKCAVATLAYMQYQYRLIGDYQKNLNETPENKFLKRFKFVDDQGRFLKEGKLVNMGGDPVNEDGIPLNKITKPEPPKPFLDDNGNPILDEEYQRELDLFNKENPPEKPEEIKTE